MADTFLVFFPSERCDLDRAVEHLARYRLTTSRDGDRLQASRAGSPVFEILLNREVHVREEAKEIGAGTSHAEAMAACGARFEVCFESLAQALDEINTMMDVQGALQDASRGYLFTPWNGVLTAPYAG